VAEQDPNLASEVHGPSFNYSELKTQPAPEREDFLANAQDVSKVFYEQREQVGVQKAFENVRQWYAEEALHPQLKAQTELILDSIVIADSQTRLNQLEAKGRDKSEAEWAESKRLKAAACHFNMKLKDLIQENPGAIQKPDLENWLQIMTRNPGWAGKTVSGAAAEVGVVRGIQQIAGPDSVIKTSVEEDLRGADFKLADGQLTIDVKSGGKQLDSGFALNRQRGFYEYGVDPHEINDDFNLTPSGLAKLEVDLKGFTRAA
jgi:hypothetical protein